MQRKIVFYRKIAKWGLLLVVGFSALSVMVEVVPQRLEERLPPLQSWVDQNIPFVMSPWVWGPLGVVFVVLSVREARYWIRHRRTGAEVKVDAGDDVDDVLTREERDEIAVLVRDELTSAEAGWPPSPFFGGTCQVITVSEQADSRPRVR